MKLPVFKYLVRAAQCLIVTFSISVNANTVQTEFRGQFSSLDPIINNVPVNNLPKSARLSDSGVYILRAIFANLDIFGVVNLSYQADRDPLMNFRLEVENFTDAPQFFSYQIRGETDLTAGPTFRDAFVNTELIDRNNDGFASLNSANTFIEVVDDPGGNAINGSANLGEAFFYSLATPGKSSLFDIVGSGPNSDNFGGAGFNYMRFRTEGVLSAGDRLVITGMGCYSGDENYCPERYELPTAVPIPASFLLFSPTFGILAYARSQAIRTMV